MKEVSKIINLTKGLIIQPRTVINSINIISYDTDTLNNLFIYLSICIIIIASVIAAIQGIINMGLIFIMVMIGPFAIIMGYRILTMYFYLIFKIGGKEIKINHDIIQRLLNPIFLVHLFLSGIIMLVKEVFDTGIVAIWLDLYLLFWFGYTLFLILRDKLKQSTLRSISIIILPIAIPIVIGFLIKLFF